MQKITSKQARKMTKAELVHNLNKNTRAYQSAVSANREISGHFDQLKSAYAGLKENKNELASKLVALNDAKQQLQKKLSETEEDLRFTTEQLRDTEKQADQHAAMIDQMRQAYVAMLEKTSEAQAEALLQIATLQKQVNGLAQQLQASQQATGEGE